MAFFMNNPRLAGLEDEELKKQLGRQAFFKGLGDLGLGLLSQSGFREGSAPTLGEAFGKAAPAFSEGADEVITQGLLVDEERRKALAEKQRKERLGELFQDANDPAAAEAGMLLDNESLQTLGFKKPDPEKPGGGITASQKATVKRLFNSEAAGLFGGDVDPATGAFRVFDKDRSKVREIGDEAMRLYLNGEADLDSAVQIAARKKNVDLKNLKNVQQLPTNVDFNQLEK